MTEQIEPPPGGFRDPDALRRRAGVGGDTNQDQHFLIDDRVLDRLPAYLPADADRSHLLEIGAGTGALTDRLLAAGDRVTAVERDTRLVEFCQGEFADALAADRLNLIAGDALSVPLPEYTACVANLPYGISSEILFRLFPDRRPLVVTVQREFAERLVAPPDTPEYGRLSVSAGHYTTPEIVERLPRSAFDPQPRVESAVVRCVPSEPGYQVPDDDDFLRFVKALFTQRRKTVRNGIRNTTHISGIDDAAAVVEAVDETTLSARPGALAPDEFAKLARIAARVTTVEAP